MHKVTMLAPKAPQPTMLAPSPAATQLAGPAQPTTLAPPGEAEREAQTIAPEPRTTGKGPHGAPAGLDDVLQDWFSDQGRAGGKDPIAESVESNVDLSGGRSGAGPTSSGELARSLMEGAEPPRPGETSAVDLGSVPDLQLASAGELERADALRPVGGETEGESSSVDLGSHPSLDLPFSGDSDQKGAGRPRVPEDGSAPKLGSDPTVEVDKKLSGLEEGEVDWDKVPSEEAEDENRLSAVGMAAAAAARGKAAPPKYGRRWVGGGLIGLGLGAAACIGLFVTGVEPFTKDRQKQLGGMLGVTTPADRATTTEGFADWINNGQYDRTIQWLDTNFDESNKEHMATRGQARWILYLQEQNGGAPKRSDEKVKQAMADLSSADTPEALFWLGHIQESLGESAKARESYAKGKAKAEGAQKRKFEAALHRLDLNAPGAEAGAGARLPLPPIDPRVRAEAILILVMQLQAGGTDTADDEAGYYFWEAAKAAKANQFDEARKLLDKARQLHAKNRFARLRKGQNPNSDPTEEIFLKACDELKNYWKMRDELENKSEYKLAKYKDPAAALEALINDQKTAAAAAKGGEILPELGKALGLKDEKPELKAVTDKIGELVPAKKLADELTTALTDGKYISDEQKDVSKGLQAAIKDAKDKKALDDKLTAVTKRLEKSGIKGDDVEKSVDQLATERDTLNETMQEAAKQLAEAKFLDDPKTDRKKFLEAVEQTIEATRSPLTSALARMGSGFSGVRDLGTGVASTVNLAGRLAASQAQNARYVVLLQQARTPQELFDIYIPLLESSTSKEILDMANLDVQRVLKDAGASPELKAQARCVEGLALRNQGKYDEARKALATALKGGPKQGEWRMAAQRALKDLDDPTAYFLPRAEEMHDSGQLEQAQALLNTGLKIFPNNGQLLALRSQVQLEMAQSKAKGRLTAQDPAVAAATKDAQDAVAAGATAPGNFALGRIAEVTRNMAGAEQSYRAAVKAHPANDLTGSRYRVALARVLIQRRPVPAQAPEARVSQLLTPNSRRLATSTDLVALVVLLTTGLQPGLDEQPMPDVDEALKLAEAAIKAGNYEGYLIKAQALARKGQWTQALEEYVKGIDLLSRSGQARLKPAYAAELRFLIDNHPAFKRPDSLSPPDPILGEKHFALAMRLYNSHLFPQAEKEFFEAVRYNDQDARYWYYLGLARLMQGKRTEAADSFEAGSLLERQNKPNAAAVSLSLERVQGPIRQTLNSYRP
jgi:hypothetical protein